MTSTRSRTRPVVAGVILAAVACVLLFVLPKLKSAEPVNAPSQSMRVSG